MKTFREHIAEDTAKDNIHRAIGSDWRYDVTNSPENDRKHISYGKGHGIKVVVKEPNKEHGAMYHRDEVVKMLKRDGHKVSHGILSDSPGHQEFHLSVFHKK